MQLTIATCTQSPAPIAACCSDTAPRAACPAASTTLKHSVMFWPPSPSCGAKEMRAETVGMGLQGGNVGGALKMSD